MISMVEFAGGDGSPANPCLIETAAQLNEIRNHENLSFRQIADIDLSGSNWTPIPNFRGTYDGNSHWITGLTVNTTGNGGLIAVLWGTIDNMVISNANVRGGQYTGILAGYINHTGIVQDCCITGNSSGGHITAVNTGTITNCIDGLPPKFAGGNGSAHHPYRISTPFHLSIMKYFPHRYFMIVNDIDLTGQIVNRDPTSAEAYGYISSFVGKLDGMGCIISGLTAPLFQSIGDGYEKNPTTIVENIRVGDVNIIQPQNPTQACIGAFVSSYNYSNVVIKNCSVESGYIAGDDISGEIGGFAGKPKVWWGRKNSQIINCFTNVNITSGLLGSGFVIDSIRARILNCYTTGNVTAKSAFGFMGRDMSTNGDGGSIKNVYIKGSLRTTSQNNPVMAGFSGLPIYLSDSFVVLCPSMVIDYPPPSSVIPTTIAVTYCGMHGGMFPDIYFVGYHLPITLDVPVNTNDMLVYGGKTITEEQSHTRSWWKSTMNFEFTDENPNNPWTWDTKTQLPIIIIPRKPIPPLEGDEPDEPGKSTVHDWNLRGVYPLAERGLMWGYWGTRR